MQFKFLSIFVLITLGVIFQLVHGAGVEPESKCFNPQFKSYASWADFAKEFVSKFDKTNIADLGDAKDSAQAFVCVSAVFKWLHTFGSKTYWLDVYNESSGALRVFGADINPGAMRKGEIVNGKGYYIWGQDGKCKMTRFGDNSSIFFNENIQIRDDGIYGGPRRDSYKLNSCTIVEIDKELCENEFLTMPQETYVFEKWVYSMKRCGTTHQQPRK